MSAKADGVPIQSDLSVPGGVFERTTAGINVDPGERAPGARDSASMQACSGAEFLYFAYGSNLLSRRLLERTPSARKVCAGILRRHALAWHKTGEDGSGKCDVVGSEEAHAEVHGVVYRIATAEKPRLDAAESLGVGYLQKRLPIETEGGVLHAWIYYANAIDAAAVPYDWYHALVLAGALEHGLPGDYIERLRAVRSRPDNDPARAERHFRLARAAQP